MHFGADFEILQNTKNAFNQSRIYFLLYSHTTKEYLVGFVEYIIRKNRNSDNLNPASQTPPKMSWFSPGIKSKKPVSDTYDIRYFAQTSEILITGYIWGSLNILTIFPDLPRSKKPSIGILRVLDQ